MVRGAELHCLSRVDAEDPNTRAVLGWSADYVIGMLHSFVEAADVSTVPALSEYRILPSKVSCRLVVRCAVLLPWHLKKAS